MTISLLIDNDGGQAVLLDARFRASWVPNWMSPADLPASIPARAQAVRIPLPPIPAEYAEKLEKEEGDACVWFELRLPYRNTDNSRLRVMVRQRYPLGHRGLWEMEEQTIEPQTSEEEHGVLRIRRRKAALLAIMILTGLLSVHLYKCHKVKTTLRECMQKDTVLIERFLDMLDSPGVTRAECFEKARKNIDAREGIAYDLQMSDPYLYDNDVHVCVSLLKVENEFLRSCIAYEVAAMNLEVARQGITGSYEKETRAQQRLKTCQDGMLTSLNAWLQRERRYASCRRFSRLALRKDLGLRLETLRNTVIAEKEFMEDATDELKRTFNLPDAEARKVVEKVIQDGAQNSAR